MFDKKSVVKICASSAMHFKYILWAPCLWSVVDVVDFHMSFFFILYIYNFNFIYIFNFIYAYIFLVGEITTNILFSEPTVSVMTHKDDDIYLI